MDWHLTVEAADLLRAQYETECINLGALHERDARWSVKEQSIFDLPNLTASYSQGADYKMAFLKWDEGVVRLFQHEGMVNVAAAASTGTLADEYIAEIRKLLPEDEPSDDRIVVTFWTASQRGGTARKRDLDATTWEEIEGNYSIKTANHLSPLMSTDFRPGIGGQLIFWHGEPGTGKTTALRALAAEWRKWCSLHYIVDPDVFFGLSADYMMRVLLAADEYGDVDEDAEVKDRWRLLVLEDCGEMLAADAKREVGQQALARFLNACDGLIGRGLRVLVLVTTNEPVSKLHEAVTRPGRCAAVVDFETFSWPQAFEWMERHGIDPSAHVHKPYSLADLYAIEGDFARQGVAKATVGFG